MDDATVLQQLEQARQLGLADKSMFPQVVKQILQLCGNPSTAVQLWCAGFLREAFTLETLALHAVRVDLAIDSLPQLPVLLATRDTGVFAAAVDVATVVYKLAFRFVAENDGLHHVWARLGELKAVLVGRLGSPYPWAALYDAERDQRRNLKARMALLKFAMAVVDFQLRLLLPKFWLLARVPPNHLLIQPQAMEAEAHALLMAVLRPLTDDVIVAPLCTATLNHLAVVVRRKRHLAEAVAPVLERFALAAKLQSNYESLAQFKLARKYVDRTLRILLVYMTKLQVVPPKYGPGLARKLAALTAHSEEIRKKNLVAPSPQDDQIRKRKFEGFHFPSKKTKPETYTDLYRLANISTDLALFDFSTLPQPILVRMALTAVAKAPPARLVKALEIVAARYGGSATVKQEQPETDKPDDEGFDPDANFTLPPPQPLLAQDKKDHVKLIVLNFFELAAKGGAADDIAPGSGAAKELTKVAISAWTQDSWLVLLTRLALRGMATDASQSDGASPSAELSDIIRQAIFDYFLARIHDRVDSVIEWLNEEWFAEKVRGQQLAAETVRAKWTAEYEQDPLLVGDLEGEIQREIEATPVATPVYDKWVQQVLDAMIPFLEPTDRKVFLRLLSDLPALDRKMILGIRSLCADPGRAKLGFLLLQFLIMYRPPVKEACLDLLREMAADDDLKEEAEKLLAKYQE